VGEEATKLLGTGVWVLAGESLPHHHDAQLVEFHSRTELDLDWRD